MGGAARVFSHACPHDAEFQLSTTRNRIRELLGCHSRALRVPMSGALCRAASIHFVKLPKESVPCMRVTLYDSTQFRRSRALQLCPLSRRWQCSLVEVRSFSKAQEWAGLPAWRMNPLNELRVWGRDGPATSSDGFVPVVAESSANAGTLVLHLRNLERERETCFQGRGARSLAEWGAIVLGTADPIQKAVFTHHAYQLWCNGDLPLGVAQAPESPARPKKPELVHPRAMPQQKDTTLTPSAHALHNLAHIELNAIDLAWDTVVRFSNASEELDLQFFADFAHVADDESRHCLWCLQRLSELGFSYGDMPAHNLLLRDCQKTSGSVMARLAVIPMVQEARGLDAGPRMVERLMGHRDSRSADIAECIADEEVAHVGVGVSWFLEVCRQLDANPAICFQDLMKECEVELRGPFNYSARNLAGLPRDWYDSAYRNSSPMRNKAAIQANETFVPTKRRETMLLGASRQKKVALSSPVSEGNDLNLATGRKGCTSRLPEIYERLALVVAMEQDNADA